MVKPNPPAHTPEQIAWAFSYDPETGLLRWSHGRPRKFRLGQAAGTPLNGRYIMTHLDRSHYLAHRLAWVIMTGEWADHEIDHIDRDGLNNKWSNLRAATGGQNRANTATRRDSRSGIKGVWRNPSSGNWVACIYLEGKTRSVGSYSTKEEAGRAYDLAAIKLNGDYAYLNFPDRINEPPPVKIPRPISARRTKK